MIISFRVPALVIRTAAGVCRRWKADRRGRRERGERGRERERNKKETRCPVHPSHPIATQTPPPRAPSVRGQSMTHSCKVFPDQNLQNHKVACFHSLAVAFHPIKSTFLFPFPFPLPKSSAPRMEAHLPSDWDSHSHPVPFIIHQCRRVSHQQQLQMKPHSIHHSQISPPSPLSHFSQDDQYAVSKSRTHRFVSKSRLLQRPSHSIRRSSTSRPWPYPT